MDADFDAIIVGAGPAGSSAAILLARAGWRVALVEKQRFPRRKVCGECIAASNLPLLDALGIRADVEAGAGPVLRDVVLMRAHASVTARLPAASGDERFGVALGRETLDTSLLHRAVDEGARVFQSWSVEAIDGEPGDWTGLLRANGSHERVRLRARVAIDAHGSWEPLSSARAASRRPRRPSDLIAFKANFRDAALRAGAIVVLAFDGGYGGMVVAGDGVTTVACCIRRDRLEATRARYPGLDAGEAVEAWLVRECDGVRAALALASRDGSWLASGPLDPGVRLPGAHQPHRIGNAAAEAHPIIGEGMSMALQSAWLLCERLIDRERGGAIPDGPRQRAISAGYARDWRRHFGRRLRIASLFAHAAMRPTIASTMMRILTRMPWMLTLGAAAAGKRRSVVDPAFVALLSASVDARSQARPRAVLAPAFQTGD